LETKANGMFDVHIHHGPSKLKTLKAAKEKDVCVTPTMTSEERFENWLTDLAQVIITTYHTLWAECKTPEDVDEAELLNYVHQSGGILPRMNWHRYVISCDIHLLAVSYIIVPAAESSSTKPSSSVIGKRGRPGPLPIFGRRIDGVLQVRRSQIRWWTCMQCCALVVSGRGTTGMISTATW
jgi:hypothetical protein